jgi:ATP-binding cassette subfamily B protein
MDLKKQSYRKHVGIVLQDPVLFTGTIGSNISLNNDDITEEDIYKALDRIGAKDFVMKYSKKLDEEIIDGGANLSFGERQLVAFARAMLYDPSVLVLDEATANIDTETEQIIQNALKSLSKDRTMFIIAHRLSTIKDVDKIVVLDRGKIIEQGNHQELVDLDGVYKKMYDAQVMAS